MKYHFLIIGLLIISINSKKEIDATEIEARISYDNTGTWKIVTDNFEEINYVATGYYNSVYEQKGFDIIAITTNKIFSDDLQAEAAGRLEGFLSRDRINYHYKNLISISGKLSNTGPSVSYNVQSVDISSNMSLYSLYPFAKQLFTTNFSKFVGNAFS